MKKSTLSVLSLATISCFFNVAFGQNSAGKDQNIIRIGTDNATQTIVLPEKDLLEIRLPSELASAGYGWYPKEVSAPIVSLFGDWKFETAQEGTYGAAGVQITRFAGSAAGQTELELQYIRPWEKNSVPVSVFKINIISKGNYSGDEKPYSNSSEAKNETPVTNSTLPYSFSWKAQGIMTPVKNQQGPICWAYATSGVFEALINAEDGVVRDLSEGWMAGCGSGGGAAFDRFVPATGPGCVYELGYTTCSTAVYHEQADSWKTVNWGMPPVDTIKNYIYNYGPVYVGVCAAFMDFQNYHGGIFSGMGSMVDHAVILCGWSDSAGGYWIMRNSWGSNWGESGYMRIAWNSNKIGTGMSWLKYKYLLNQTATDVAQTTAPATELNVFPNPAYNGNFSIAIDQPLEKEYELSIETILGQRVYHETIEGKRAVHPMSMINLQKGIYMIRLTGKEGTYSTKLIVP